MKFHCKEYPVEVPVERVSISKWTCYLDLWTFKDQINVQKLSICLVQPSEILLGKYGMKYQL